MRSHLDNRSVSNHAFGLYGIPGVGKSSAALQFLNQNAERFKYCFWVYAETEHKIKKSMDGIASHISLDTTSDTRDRTAKHIKEWLQTNTGWLVIFDNVENMDHILPYWPRQHSLDSYIVVTSRDMDTVSRTSHITNSTKLDCFEVEEAVEWFMSQTNRLNAHEKARATKIVKICGCLPLALHHVVA